MKLSSLTSYAATFKVFLSERDDTEVHRYKYLFLDNFRHAWSDTTDLATRYSRSLQSDTSRRWWLRTGYEPKQAMLTLIREHPEYAAEAFKDLFDESRSLDGRLDRFVFYSDELLRIHRSSHPDDHLNDHYQDWSIIALYLAGRYPDRYTLYPGREIFNAYLTALEARPSAVDDLERFFKVMRTTCGFLHKHDDLSMTVQRTGRPGDNLLLAHEFVYFVTGRWTETTP